VTAQTAFSRPTSEAKKGFAVRAHIVGTGETKPADDIFPAAGAVLSFPQDRLIYAEGETANVFFKVVSGVVRTCKFMSDGRRQIDAFYVAGEIFGFETGVEHLLSAEAVCDCMVVPLRRKPFDSLSGETVPRELLAFAMRNFARAQEHSLLLGRRSAIEKVAAFLLEWAEPTKAGHVVNLAMTRHDIADYLGLTIETISRTLSQLERDKIIELSTVRQILIKDITALRDMQF